MRHEANTDGAAIAARDADATIGIIQANRSAANILTPHLKLVLPRVDLLEVLGGRGQFLVRGTRQGRDNDLACKSQTTS